MLQSCPMRFAFFSTMMGLLLSLPACAGSSGPSLPPDVGANHTAGAEASRAETAEAPPEPVEVGTVVWGNFHDTGFYFHGVVVERREDMHRVLYDDGATEWLPAGSLLPDSLGEDAVVHVRPGYGGEFQSAIVGRRLGQALYVRLPNGDERWTTLPHVRFQRGSDHVPERGDTPVSSEGQSEDLGTDVLVNYQLEGLQFAGVVTAHRPDGRAHVVYLDAESQWVHDEMRAPDDVGPGTIVHVRRSWEPVEWVRGTVQQRIGPALRVQLDDGGLAWTSMFRVRVPVDGQAPVDGRAPVEQAPADEAPID